MARARFRFHGELGTFLARERRDVSFAYDCARAATLKNAIEALGVPHTETGRVVVNGHPATLDRIVREADEIEILPWAAGSDPGVPLRFVADAHLGGLARFLRMLGFDALHENCLGDEQIRRLAGEEQRIVLTRDRELLKCRDVLRGCYVHALRPEGQLAEVNERYGLAARARPFTLCLRCNLPLEAVPAETVAGLIPPRVAQVQRAFRRCAGCTRIYWPGTHYERMQRALGRILEAHEPQ